MFSLCLFVCEQDYTETVNLLFTKFDGNVHMDH